ncbi:MAG TPA: histidinol dehydrogenase [Candidatus Sulfotelmatobacter sp.]|jgi:histidinol dehydrogenase
MRMLRGRAADIEVQHLAGRGTRAANLEPEVRRIVNDVRVAGDSALRRYAAKWDGLEKTQPLRVSDEEMLSAFTSIHPQLRKSLKLAAQNIRRFCTWQKPKSWSRTRKGMRLGQIVCPLESVGCYVPGGRYPLVSTVLMTVIPAQVAGVSNIRVASPNPSSEVLGAAAMLGVRDFYRIGGAQAIAAFAYGTASVRRVDKIVGPGNTYVTAAKKLVAFDCAIDFLAGPTEAVILKDSGNPAFIASDLVAQAEHDVDALAVFITTSDKLGTRVAEKCRQLSKKNQTAQKSLARNGAVLIAVSREQALEWANQLAPEHLTIDQKDLPLVRNAGSVFVGDYSAQAAGDYASGPNHVLPTAGQARFRGGLSVLDFVKITTVQELSRAELCRMAPAIESLAAAEGLSAHGNSIRVRCEHA